MASVSLPIRVNVPLTAFQLPVMLAVSVTVLKAVVSIKPRNFQVAPTVASMPV